MPAERLSRLRWALSPVGELAAALILAADLTQRDRMATHLRLLLRSGRFPALAAVCGGFTVYLPEMLTPPPLSFSPDVEEQLHQVATTGVNQVGSQFTAFLSGGAARRRRCPWLTPGHLDGVNDQVRDRLEVHPSDLRETLAGELHAFWKVLLADGWPRLASSAEEFVDRQAGTAAREGVGVAFAGLHSSLSWRDAGLDVASPYAGRVGGGTPLILSPSLLLRRIGLHSPLLGEGAQVVVPVAARNGPGVPSIAPILGSSRLAILKSLDRRRTTTELAARHHMTPGSVSYHLSRLLQADLVRRERSGRLVHYSLTSRARNLLRSSPSV
ncbi:ArsR/SmtB family transcription factor [Streptomyces sp. CA-179760]|uniref:ArsR/SmtB family transcription factor n=1 Tax=Streptomyces sp. CA-179760 TaxID=3240054 RepID=UPI003D8CC405